MSDTSEDPGNRITPVFLFSLPRSGSTLTQRVLAAHQKIATSPEPWVLLPLLYSLKREGVYAEYGHKLAVGAIEDFSDGLPGGRQAYVHDIREFVVGLYSKHAKIGATYFVDKTPRYHLVADDIVRLFETGKFIFLWRNPLAIVASMMETWSQGRWNLYEYEVDLFDGLASLVEAWSRHSDKAISVCYEDLVDGVTPEWQRVFAYLGLDLDEECFVRFGSVDLGDRMGDQTGRYAYRALSTDPMNKWKQTLSNPLRKAWCRRYLSWIGRDRLAIMGYDIDRLRGELDSVPTTMRYLSSDILRTTWGVLARTFELWLAYDKLLRWRSRKRFRAHI